MLTTTATNAATSDVTLEQSDQIVSDDGVTDALTNNAAEITKDVEEVTTEAKANLLETDAEEQVVNTTAISKDGTLVQNTKQQFTAEYGTQNRFTEVAENGVETNLIQVDVIMTEMALKIPDVNSDVEMMNTGQKEKYDVGSMNQFTASNATMTNVSTEITMVQVNLKV